jgi:hypothetical protein
MHHLLACTLTSISGTTIITVIIVIIVITITDITSLNGAVSSLSLFGFLRQANLNKFKQA